MSGIELWELDECEGYTAHPTHVAEADVIAYPVAEAQALEAVYETAREYEELVEAGVHHRDYSNAFARLQAAIDAVLSIRETRPR